MGKFLPIEPFEMVINVSVRHCQMYINKFRICLIIFLQIDFNKFEYILICCRTWSQLHRIFLQKGFFSLFFF